MYSTAGDLRRTVLVVEAEVEEEEEEDEAAIALVFFGDTEPTKTASMAQYYRTAKHVWWLCVQILYRCRQIWSMQRVNFAVDHKPSQYQIGCCAFGCQVARKLGTELRWSQRINFFSMSLVRIGELSKCPCATFCSEGGGRCSQQCSCLCTFDQSLELAALQLPPAVANVDRN